ncbi:hypothetical protein DRW03_00210 [Corallococcus sp. H22C18031201]|uniref:AraC family ligand binding domain-containing protein n=1 Tax=Citreicoccus inhibens TaxID=2849499 RepID=UPI000E742434|nr:AraC family ligand binding domain-containing protein [Citreicoccus inhibens]MBU8899948.1 AraC family ligand binding domain-containing protein [Citreicoccus inhibens]RJS27894.1 hypothetical protein DRW03_00210 [Corallococcus sp. H22C18031201]
MEESEAQRAGQVWRPEAYPGVWLYRVQGRRLTEAPHVHPELQLTLDSAQLQEGMSGGHHWLAPPGSLVVVPPGEVHLLRAEGGRPGMLYGLMLPLEALSEAVAASGLHTPWHGLRDSVLGYPQLARDFVSLHRALRSPGHSPAVASRLRAFLAALVARLAPTDAEPSAQSTVAPG